MKKIFISILCFLYLVAACNDLSNLNEDKKAITSATVSALSNAATKSLADQIIRQQVNYNNYRLWVEHWTETTYTDEANYEIIGRSVPASVYREIYRDALIDFKEATRLIDESLKTEGSDSRKLVLINQKSIIEILSVLAFSHLVESFGDIPYSEALDIANPTPKYDDGLTVYKALISRIKKAIEAIDTSQGGLEIDNIYGGNMTLWKKYGASIYLRMGMVLADVDANLSKTTVEDAIAKGVFTSNSDNALLTYAESAPNRNPVYNTITASGRSDYVIAENLVDKLNALNDPRRSFFYTKIEDGTYKGGVVGDGNSYGNFSHVSDMVGADPDRKGRLMDFSEVSFLLAEAKERGYNVSGTAETHYENAITASIKFWGGSNEDVTAYLGQASVQYDTTNYKELIGTQMWIAMYDRGYAAWLHWRRYDHPTMKGATQGRTSDKQPPRRLTYPVSEQTLNGVSYQAAANAIGGDTMETKLFWDKN